jgi:hypothetical protein
MKRTASAAVIAIILSLSGMFLAQSPAAAAASTAVSTNGGNEWG